MAKEEMNRWLKGDRPDLQLSWTFDFCNSFFKIRLGQCHISQDIDTGKLKAEMTFKRPSRSPTTTTCRSINYFLLNITQ